MAVRSNPHFIDELQDFGAKDVTKCYQCGNCSAACPHSQAPHIFPRRAIKCLQLGLEAPLRASLDPWLCYYCGDCSTQCPRGAEPGETMMSLRRWLTSQYDFTGISRLLYASGFAQLGAVFGLAILTGIGFFYYGFHFGGGDLNIYDGPRAFLPAHAVHVFDWIMGGVVAALLFVNCVRMWYFTMCSKDAPRVPLSLYLRNIYEIPLHFFTQKSFKECGHKKMWASHLVLMLSYVTMLILIMVFLAEVQDGPAINWWVHTFGYLAAAGLIGTSLLALRGRLQHGEAYHRRSHRSDWIFLGLVLFISVSGIVQHILHRTGYCAAANITYVAHLMAVVPMLTTGEPFNKWSHLAYRPLGIYLARVQQAAVAAQAAEQEQEPLVVLTGAKG